MVGLFYLDMSFNIRLVTGLTTLWFINIIHWAAPELSLLCGCFIIFTKFQSHLWKKLQKMLPLFNAIARSFWLSWLGFMTLTTSSTLGSIGVQGRPHTVCMPTPPSPSPLPPAVFKDHTEAFPSQMRCTNLQEGILVKLPKPLQLFYFNSSVWACRHYIEIKAAVDKSCVNWAAFWQVTIIFTSSDIFLVTAYRKSNAFVYYCTLRKVSDSLSKSNPLNCLLNSCIVSNDYTRATSSMFYLLIKNMNLLIYCQSPFELSCLLVKKCDHFC